MKIWQFSLLDFFYIRGNFKFNNELSDYLTIFEKSDYLQSKNFVI